MKAWMRSSDSRRPAPTTTIARPSSRTRSNSLRRSVTSGTRSRPRGSSSSAPSRSRSIAARCARSHGTPPNCSACVISCSATQRRSWSSGASRRARRVGEVGRDEQQPRGLLGLQHRELVLAEHAAGEEARRRRPPRSPARRRRTCRAGRLAAEPLAPSARARSSQRAAGSRRSSPTRSTASAAGTGWRRRARCRRRRAARPRPRARRAARTAPGCRRAAGWRRRGPRSRRASSRSHVQDGSRVRLRPDRARSRTVVEPFARCARRSPASAARDPAARPSGSS